MQLSASSSPGSDNLKKSWMQGILLNGPKIMSPHRQEEQCLRTWSYNTLWGMLQYSHLNSSVERQQGSSLGEEGRWLL
jgi:hypothetical protein